jgi:hypothetical protein
MRFIFLSLIMLNWGFSTQAQCFENRHAFAPGEEVTYNAYYNLGFVWINAGKVTFAVNDTSWNDKPALHFKGYGATYKAYDILFRVRDSFDVWVDPYSLKPFEFHRRTNEGSYSAHYHYLFDDENRQIQTSISKKGSAYRDSTIAWPKCSFDLLSMVYQARNIDFSLYSVNDKIPISMVVDGDIYDLYIRYLGKEIIKDRSGRKFRCLKFSPLLMEGTIFEKGEKMAVWVTDDNNKIPVVVEAKILVGSVKAVFVEAKGLEYPVAAEIKEED